MRKTVQPLPLNSLACKTLDEVKSVHLRESAGSRQKETDNALFMPRI